jgi:cardiolipin synthase
MRGMCAVYFDARSGRQAGAFECTITLHFTQRRSMGTHPLPATASELGHRFTWLHTGTAAFDRMIAMIDAAVRSVDLEFYTVARGTVSDRLGAALRHAAQRQVRVRILMDAFGSAALPATWSSQLRAAGADVRWFNPRRLLRWSFRNHRKLVVCDDRCAWVGGFNVADEYAGDGIERGWRDFGVYIEGPVAVDLMRGFVALFDAAALKRLQLPPLARFLRKQRVKLNAPAALVGGPGSSRALMRQTVHADLKSASRVDAMAAYFVPSRKIRTLLRQVNRRGTVRIVLAAKSDVPVSRWASQWLYPRLLRNGAAVWEYQPQILHAKVMVIDDVVYVGSANLDTRSLQLNFELLVRLPSAVLAEQVRARIDYDCELSKAVPADWSQRRTLVQRLVHSWSYFLLTKIDPFLARKEFRHQS